MQGLALQPSRGPDWDTNLAAGHRSVVVSYAVAEDQILVRLPDYNDIVHYAPGAEVSLDVDGGTPPPIAKPSSSPAQPPWRRAANAPMIDQAAFEEDWPPDVRTSVICLPLNTVEGFELRDP